MNSNNDNMEYTMQFDVAKNREVLTKTILTEVYKSLKEKGYNPVNQLVGYLMSGDPTYCLLYTSPSPRD